MLSFPAAIKVYLCTVPCDMRRSFDGLSMMAEHVIRCNPFSGHLLVFCNRRTDRLKILYWDRDGWAIWYKRLEAGTFQFPFSGTGRKEIAAWELGLLLEGIDLSKGQRRKRGDRCTLLGLNMPAGNDRDERTGYRCPSGRLTHWSGLPFEACAKALLIQQ
jgi:transposase